MRKQKSVRSSQKKSSGNRRKVFIVEDHPVFREGLRQMINRERDMKVCGEAGNYEDAVEAIGRLAPDVALVDITLPGKSGLELIKTLRASNNQIKILIVSMHDQALYADRVLRAGGDGYIMKQEDPVEIVHAVRDVLAGRIYVSEQVIANGTKGAGKHAQPKSPGIEQLSDWELEFLEALGRGKSNREIAQNFSLGIRAVEVECKRIAKKLKVNGTNALIRYAVCWMETGKG